MPKSRKRVSKSAKKRGARRPTNYEIIRRTLHPVVVRRLELFEQAKLDAIAAMPKGCRVNQILDPVRAAAPLRTVRLAIENLGSQYAQSMGSYSWLFWLRRLPSEVFSGRLASTGPYVQALAEAMSAFTRTTEEFTATKKRSVIPKLNDSQLEVLMKMCGLATVLAGIHAVIRRAGKGQAVRWSRNDLPFAVSDDKFEKMIELYDQRALSGGEVAGTVAFDWHPLFTRVEATPAGQFALVVYSSGDLQEVPFWIGPASKVKRGVFRPGRYVVGGMTLKELRRLIGLSGGISDWPSRELASLVIFLRTIMMLVLNQDIRAGQSLPSVGYLVLPTSAISKIIEHELPWNLVDLADLFAGRLPNDAQQVLSDIRALEPSVWPVVKGPILREAGDQTIVDIDSSTQLIDRMLTVPGQYGGNLVNARAEHFEEYVQQIIDQTPWAPDASLRSYRGKTLRLHGKSITDIDAIAVKAKSMILVSCKSVPYTQEYDIGNYNTVRNVRTLLEDADREWRSRLATLVNNPKGDNYNFEDYILYGTVCTPHVAFVYEQQARIVLRTEQHALRATCTVAELKDFLESGGEITNGTEEA